VTALPLLEPDALRSPQTAPAAEGGRGPAPGALRAILRDRFPDAVPLPDRVVPPIPTGLAVLDGILPNGGLPRGRLTVWQSPHGAASALLRAATASVLDRGERVAWIDGARTLGHHWDDGPLVVRPASLELALRATEILLRSGGFALVVLAGVDPESTAMLRLSRMAHEGGGGFLAVTRRSLTASLRITSRYLPLEHRTVPGPFGHAAQLASVAVAIESRAPGWKAATTLHLPLVSHDLRLSLEPGLADRRGALD
jgi:hypothetical protein